MLVTNHVLAGAVLGHLVRRPVPAFLLGVVSHFVLDAVPHWGKEGLTHREFMNVAVPDGLTGLAAMAAAGAGAHPSVRLAVLAAMAGASLPDLNKPGRVFLGRSPFPAVVDRFHGCIQREDAGRMGQEFLVGGALVAVIGCLSVASRRSRLTRSAG